MAKGEIRYFLDYVKSNEIILEERKKRDEKLKAELLKILIKLILTTYFMGKAFEGFNDNNKEERKDDIDNTQ